MIRCYGATGKTAHQNFTNISEHQILTLPHISNCISDVFAQKQECDFGNRIVVITVVLSTTPLGYFLHAALLIDW